ncbi:neuronal acetylcholine receptor subunit beta-4-like [Glandiceps talaboti]
MKECGAEREEENCTGKLADEKSQIITINGISKSVWQDYQLHWDPADYDGMEEVVVPEEWVWRPRTALLNSATDDYFVPTSGIVTIYYNSTVRAATLATFKFPCSLDIRNFPFDTQTCSAIFTPFLYNTDYMVSETLPDKVLGEAFAGHNTEWSVQSGTSQVVTLTTHYPTEDWSVIMVTFGFKRRPLYYIMNIIIPCALMAVLTLFVYLLPCDCGEKMSFSVSVLIAMSVFSLLVGDIMPPTSESVPLIVRYLLFNMVLVSFSILIATFVLRLHHRTRRHLRMAPWIKRVFIDVLPSLMMMEKCKAMKVSSEVNTVQPLFKPSNKPTAKGGHTDQNVTIMDISYEERNLVELNNQKNECSNFGVQTLKTDVFHEMLQEVRQQRKKTEAAEEDDALLEDWKYVATVVDRLFLWISFIVYIIGTIIMFADVDY